MKRLTLVFSALILVLVPFYFAWAEEESETDDLTISSIMKSAHKGGLLKRVTGGSATDEDKQQLLDFYEALAEIKPPMGDSREWAERTTAMIDAAKSAVGGDTSKLKRAVNCRDCHTYHKP
ncbi:MAG: hypothetical protein ACI8UO_005247 [Verrucomicrobiales bacterium]|jgi:hypothetical protein